MTWLGGWNASDGYCCVVLRVAYTRTQVVLEVFAGGGRSVATIASDKQGVDPAVTDISVGVSTGQATMDIRVWSMGCGWTDDVHQY